MHTIRDAISPIIVFFLQSLILTKYPSSCRCTPPRQCASFMLVRCSFCPPLMHLFFALSSFAPHLHLLSPLICSVSCQSCWLSVADTSVVLVFMVQYTPWFPICIIVQYSCTLEATRAGPIPNRFKHWVDTSQPFIFWSIRGRIWLGAQL